MKTLRAWFAVLLLGALFCSAGAPGYLPVSGPVPLRFAPLLSSLPRPQLPPLSRSTPVPVDPAAASNTTPTAAAADLTAVSTNAVPDPITIWGSPAPADLYSNGVPTAPSIGWPLLLVTNRLGLVPVTVGSGPPVTFAPPTPSPSSRATYTVAP